MQRLSPGKGKSLYPSYAALIMVLTRISQPVLECVIKSKNAVEGSVFVREDLESTEKKGPIAISVMAKKNILILVEIYQFSDRNFSVINIDRMGKPVMMNRTIPSKVF
ncbi:hypothetical protein TNIN_411461 [Trichonephila inaurata madagascariensis]|uniref:Uncharacterized protein n=1 Tax=Trichonephila inaurata madagascariensis TaxID=2747483 RepID=A0A8X6WYQ0_9ARAC|nr:hypothetical protein TNIN_411461 [Trichonephila inaurata madagascariensis]